MKFIATVQRSVQIGQDEFKMYSVSAVLDQHITVSEICKWGTTVLDEPVSITDVVFSEYSEV